jgi:hypothetical protein
MAKAAAPTIFTGGARVIASGTVIAFKRTSDIRFQLGPVEERLVISFRFDDGIPKVPASERVQVRQVMPREILLILRNFGHLSGEGTLEPIKLGNLAGLQLYVNFVVFGLPGSAKPTALHYTFYERDDEAEMRRDIEAALARHRAETALGKLK